MWAEFIGYGNTGIRSGPYKMTTYTARISGVDNRPSERKFNDCGGKLVVVCSMVGSKKILRLIVVSMLKRI